MSNARLSKFIEDPYQKFYYIFNFQRPLDFLVELIKISMNEEPGVTYPYCARTSGEAPKQFISTTPPKEEGDEFEEDDLGVDDENKITEEFGIDQDEHETEADEHDDEFEGAEGDDIGYRSEEHTSEIQSLMRISYAVLCLKKKKEKI